MTTTEVLDIEAKRSCGFRKGLGRVGSDFKTALLVKLKHGLGLGENSIAAFYKRVNGETSLTPIEVVFVHESFIEAHVPPDCIWDL
ncbi:hypothetical protein ACLOAU_14395 [Niabella sp. CJ426]|uniref:hypothetical protein n=1 Tax=Niabella sp. CJ426 TaxID=3393740 RepID=UPI003D0009F7